MVHFRGGGWGDFSAPWGQPGVTVNEGGLEHSGLLAGLACSAVTQRTCPCVFILRALVSRQGAWSAGAWSKEPQRLSRLELLAWDAVGWRSVLVCSGRRSKAPQTGRCAKQKCISSQSRRAEVQGQVSAGLTSPWLADVCLLCFPLCESVP